MVQKKIGYIIAVLLLFAILKLPIGYYTFLRISVTGICAYYLFEEMKQNNTNKASLSTILHAILIILFNPIIPIYLDKGIWMFIDILTSFFIANHTYNYNLNK